MKMFGREEMRLLMKGAESVRLFPSITEARSYIASDGLRRDAQKIGRDMRKAMNTVDRERERA